MPRGTTRTTRVTPLGREYLERHPGIDWRAPDPGPEPLGGRMQRLAAKPRQPRPITLAAPTPIAAPIPPLHIVNSAICPPCGSGNVLHVFGRLHVCRACRAQFEVTPAESSA